MNQENKKIRIDPVCGMDLSIYSDIKKTSYDGKVFYFCGKNCEDRFKDNPGRFNGEPLIKLRNVCKKFSLGKESKIDVLKNLNLNIWEGDFVAIIGPSGSGKSTTLNIMGLLDRPTSGQVFLNGGNISSLIDSKKAKLRSSVFGFVFQQYNLIPWLTAYENVTLPLIFSEKEIDYKLLENKFEEIGLKDRINHRSFELSGGEQQRIALLRALANSPDIILGDEPTGNLDSVTGDKILKILIDLNRKHNKTLIIVTHDADIADKADQIITFKDGRIVRDHESHKKTYTE